MLLYDTAFSWSCVLAVFVAVLGFTPRHGGRSFWRLSWSRHANTRLETWFMKRPIIT